LHGKLLGTISGASSAPQEMQQKIAITTFHWSTKNFCLHCRFLLQMAEINVTVNYCHGTFSSGGPGVKF
jgi:hypothetical protein